MSWDINKVFLIGRLSNEVDLKYTPGGAAVAKFGIAVGGRPKQDGTDSVSFFNVVVWQKAAENCKNFLTKGKQVAIEGRLEQRSWTAQDGGKRSTVEVIAERVQFLGSAGGGQGGNQGGNQGGGPKNNPEKQDDSRYYDNSDFPSEYNDSNFGYDGNDESVPF